MSPRAPRNAKYIRNLSQVDPTSFGGLLRRYREEAGLSQTELGEITGFGQSRVSGYEIGRAIPDEPTIMAFARALNIKPGLLFEASKFGRVLVVDPEVREMAAKLDPDDWRYFRMAMEMMQNPSDEERERFKQQFEQFLTSWHNS